MRRREFVIGLGAAAAGAGADEKPVLRVAAASNLTAIAPRLGEAFEKLMGVRCVFSFGSTAQLARQIEQGAPFDVFAAADLVHVEELVGKGFLVRSTMAVYATGVLAVWFPKRAGKRVEDVAGPGVRVIAMARPELAPYGAAARETLENLGLWRRVQARIVYAGSVSMAKQYGSTGNADAVFLPAALALRESGVVMVAETLHKPIGQAVGVVAASGMKDAGGRFADFLSRGAGHALLVANGYR